MCGRFTRFKSWQELYDALSAFLDLPATPPNDYTTSYNVAPTQDVLALTPGEAGAPVRAAMMRWGLVPFWAKQMPKGSMFNARSETVAEKPAFRAGWKQGRRCLVVADGYYEWKTQGTAKQPYRIHLPGDRPFGFAGLWARNDQLDITSCTILTGAAAPEIAELHPRMPLILSPADGARWLDPATAPDEAAGLLGANLGHELGAYPVAREVGNVRNNHAGLIEAAAVA